MGPQEVWLELYRAGSELNTLFDPETIATDYLNSLRKLVGFGPDQDDVVTAATEEELRRIIAGAINFWRERFLDSGIEAAIRLTTGNRFKVRDFFDFRFIVGETMITEDLENSDPNMISVKTRNFFRQGTDGETRYGGNLNYFYSASVAPTDNDKGAYIVIFDDTGSPSNDGFYFVEDVDLINDIFITEIGDWFPRAATGLSFFIAFPYDEYLTEIRVVDELTGQGALNRILLEKLLELQRPSSERLNVVYVDFMDLFDVDNDLSQWTVVNTAPAVLTVDNRVLTLEAAAGPAGWIEADRPSAPLWQNYQHKSKIAFKTTGTFYIYFYWNDPKGFRLQVDYNGFGTGQCQLYVWSSGWNTVGSAVSLPSINLDTFWTYTIETYSVGTELPALVYVKVMIDGNVVIDESAASGSDKGTVAHGTTAGTRIEIAETELWQYPLEISRVGPNP
jgi:hypothetical protein